MAAALRQSTVIFGIVSRVAASPTGPRRSRTLTGWELVVRRVRVHAVPIWPRRKTARRARGLQSALPARTIDPPPFQSKPPHCSRSPKTGMAKTSSPAKSPKGKGKAPAPDSPAPAASLPPSSPAQAEAAPGPESDNQLLSLADQITARAHLLAPGQTDPELLLLAQDALKAAFDKGRSSALSTTEAAEGDTFWEQTRQPQPRPLRVRQCD